MRISVVIPTHNRPLGLGELLESLTDQHFPADELEIHVVANVAGDPGEAIVDAYRSRFNHLHWHCVGVKGVNRARNVGLRACRAPVALFFDDDCVVPHRYFLRDVERAHQDYPEATAIGGAYFTPEGANAVAIAYNHISTVWLMRRTEDGGECVNLVGGNVSYKREKLGGLEFNEQIAFGGAETDFHMRLFKAGAKLQFLDHLRIEHRARISGRDLLRKGFKQGVSAHLRWKEGLHVPNHLPTSAAIPDLPPAARLWKDAFDVTFGWGSESVRPRRPAPAGRGLTLRILWHALTRHLKFAFTRWRSEKFERGMSVGLPLERFFVMPFSTDCEHACSYCPSLGLRQPRASVSTEIARAKAYGFEKILLPCNAFFAAGAQDVLARVRESGLKPFVLVNGDHKAPIALDRARPEAGTGYHLMLGPPSEYQDRIIGMLERVFRGLTATYFHRGQLSTLKQLPALLVNRLHYAYPGLGPWRIQRAIAAAKRETSATYSMQLRPGSGYWPTGPKREAFPLLTPTLVSGPSRKRFEYSIVIPSFDSGAELVKTLAALRAQTVAASSFEVIVVDDGSRDNTEELLRAAGETPFAFIYLKWPRTGLDFRAGLARNAGVAHARGEFLCFLDADILVPPNFLEDLGRRFERNDVIQARRDMLTREASSDPNKLSGFRSEDIYADEPYWEAFKALDSWAQTANFWKYTCTYALAMRRDLFMKAGWFSPEFSTYGFEDVDLGYRLAKLGARFHLSPNTVYHLYPRRADLNFHFDYGRRQKALAQSAEVFYRNQLDPAVYRAFFPSFSERVLLILLKPYFFARYQYDKRIEPLFARRFQSVES